MERCRNCTLLGHAADTCPRWGPVHPGPGKDSSDYEHVVQEFWLKTAADEDAMFGDLDDDDTSGTRRSGRNRTPIGRQRMSFVCGSCGAESGKPCISRAGREVEHFHADRIRQVAQLEEADAP